MEEAMKELEELFNNSWKRVDQFQTPYNVGFCQGVYEAIRIIHKHKKSLYEEKKEG